MKVENMQRLEKAERMVLMKNNVMDGYSGRCIKESLVEMVLQIN